MTTIRFLDFTVIIQQLPEENPGANGRERTTRKKKQTLDN